MEKGYFQGTSKRKAQFVLIMILYLLPFILMKFGIISDPIKLNTDSLSLEESALNIYSSFYLSVYFSAYALILNSSVSIYCYIFARKVHTAKQFPPPSSQMVFRTKIIKDKKALQYAYSMYMLSAMVLLNGVVEFSSSVNMLHFVKDTLNVI